MNIYLLFQKIRLSNFRRNNITRSNLKYIYDKDSFILGIDGNYYNLESQIIKRIEI